MRPGPCSTTAMTSTPPSPAAECTASTSKRCSGAAGVSFEDRQDLLGHRSGRITTHCSAAEPESLIATADRGATKTDAPVMLRQKKESR
jgi:hypothetical protein